jgi:hypothetical protein
VHPVDIDCLASWADASADKLCIWNMFAAAPGARGYDLTPFFIGLDHPDSGVLKRHPRHVAVVTQAPPAALVW